MKTGLNLGEAYRKGKKLLLDAQNECAAFDAACIFKKVFGYDRSGILIHSDETADKAKFELYMHYIKERAAGRPLQYILGYWWFMNLTLQVGEGVLIPREETELLVHTAFKMLKDRKTQKILDLCSGTGAVALGTASLIPNADITAVEFYDKALEYLNKNIENTGYNVKSVKLDVLNLKSAKNFSGLDCIVSNPPYVKAGAISSLQTEVQKEPCTALDGGNDGLNFYRAIADIWIPKLKNGGILAVEIGEEQAQAVIELFKKSGLSNIQVLKDFNNLDRVVCGIRNVNN